MFLLHFLATLIIITQSEIHKAKDGFFPYIVSLEDIKDANFHFCSGAILNSNWIITLDSCFKDERSLNWTRIVVGSATSRIKEEEAISKFPKFKIPVGNHTVLIKLNVSISFHTWNVEPVCIGKLGHEEKQVEVSGWVGHNDTLLYTYLNASQCYERHDHICAKPNEEEDCILDRGSPVMSTYTRRLVGLNRGLGCNQDIKDLPIVKLEPYEEEIRSVMRKRK